MSVILDDFEPCANAPVNRYIIANDLTFKGSDIKMVIIPADSLVGLLGGLFCC